LIAHAIAARTKDPYHFSEFLWIVEVSFWRAATFALGGREERLKEAWKWRDFMNLTPDEFSEKYPEKSDQRDERAKSLDMLDEDQKLKEGDS
jgi:hypothetical protein